MASPQTLDVKTHVSSHDRILDAAKKLFAQKGYENSSTAAIARLAGTSESQLIKHFGGKEGLLEAIYENGWHKLTEGFSALRHVRSPKDRLYSLIDLFIVALNGDEELKQIMLLEGRRIRHGGQTILMTDGSLNMVHTIDAILEDMKKAGELKPQVHVQALRSAIAGMFGGLLRGQLLAKRINFPATYSLHDVRETFDLALSGFLVAGK